MDQPEYGTNTSYVADFIEICLSAKLSDKAEIRKRVSTQDQNVESQSRALTDWCTKQGIFNFEQVIVFSFSRFARSVSHLLKALQKFKGKNIRFVSTTEQLDTNSPMGMALFTLTGESIPGKTPFTIGLKFDPSHSGPAMLEVAHGS